MHEQRGIMRDRMIDREREMVYREESKKERLVNEKHEKGTL